MAAPLTENEINVLLDDIEDKSTEECVKNIQKTRDRYNDLITTCLFINIANEKELDNIMLVLANRLKDHLEYNICPNKPEYSNLYNLYKLLGNVALLSKDIHWLQDQDATFVLTSKEK